MEKIDPAAEFSQEASELLAQFEESLLNLEITPDDADLVDRAFGILHSLKGAGMMFGWEEFAAFIHQVETVLVRVRNRTVAVTPELVARALSIADYLRELLEPPHKVNPQRATLLIDTLSQVSHALTDTPVNLSSAPELSSVQERNRVIITPSTTQATAEQFDHLLEQINELRATHDRLSVVLPNGASDVQMLNSELRNLIKRLQETVLALRMLPIENLFKGFRRVVRDLAHQLGKNVAFTISGATTLIDKFLLKELHAPLLHLIRNALDHGIESPEQRRAVGKSPIGKLYLGASRSANGLLIFIEDDGRGIDRNLIYTRAVEQQLLQSGEMVSDAELFNFIFHPGFSTVAQLTTISGRGFGMTVVKRTLDNLGGSIEIESMPSQGTKITFRIP